MRIAFLFPVSRFEFAKVNTLFFILQIFLKLFLKNLLFYFLQSFCFIRGCKGKYFFILCKLFLNFFWRTFSSPCLWWFSQSGCKDNHFFFWFPNVFCLFSYLFLFYFIINYLIFTFFFPYLSMLVFMYFILLDDIFYPFFFSLFSFLF